MKQGALKDALSWALAACKLADQHQRRGDYTLLEHLNPALKSYFANVYLKSGPQMSGQLWAALYPQAALSVMELHGLYTESARYGGMLEAIEHDPLSTVSKWSLAELEGLLDYLEKQLDMKQAVQRTIAGMDLATLQQRLETFRAEFVRRKAELEKQAATEAIQTRLAHELKGLSEDLKQQRRN